MRCLNRNKQSIYYALYVRSEEQIDEYGNKTGSYNVIYGNPVELKANVSAARGTSDVEQFGINEIYNRTVAVDNVHCPIDEKSIIWYGLPSYMETYNSLETYSVGEYVINGNNVYRCITAIETPEEFDSDKWEKIPHNHVVVAVARSLNSVMYAIKEVKVSD